MFKHLFTFLTVFSLFFTSFLYAEELDIKFINLEEEKDTEYIISILTCGPGPELYATFGHSAVRVQEKSMGINTVYNYGVFNFSDPNFYKKFILGKLDYYLDTNDFDRFMLEYQYDERAVIEQTLDLTQEQALGIIDFLENNLLPENKAYLYDFTEDNCATRIRDILPNELGNSFTWGPILNESKSSYRHALNLELEHNHWAKFGINLLLGSVTDKKINDQQMMFLPKYLEQALEEASFEGQNIIKDAKLIQPKQQDMPVGLNGPLWMNIGILLIVALSFHARNFAYLRPIIRFLLFFIPGLLGILLLGLWISSDHQQFANNFNILWAVPTHAIFAFIIHKRNQFTKLIAFISIALIIIALIIHILGVQTLPLIEISPLLLALMYVYLDLIKNNSPEQIVE